MRKLLGLFCLVVLSAVCVILSVPLRAQALVCTTDVYGCNACGCTTKADAASRGYCGDIRQRFSPSGPNVPSEDCSFFCKTGQIQSCNIVSGRSCSPLIACFNEADCKCTDACSGATPCGTPGNCYATSGCDNTCNSTKTTDACGVCGGSVSTITCDAATPSCNTTSGADSCGSSCSKTDNQTKDICGTCGGSVTVNTCSATMPSVCGQTNTGTLACGGSCSVSSPACSLPCSGTTPCGDPATGCYAKSGCDNTCDSTKTTDICGTCGGDITVNTCSASMPSVCGQTNTGTFACGGPCSVSSAPCPGTCSGATRCGTFPRCSAPDACGTCGGSVPVNTCSATMPSSCGQTNTGTFACGGPCSVSSAACSACFPSFVIAPPTASTANGSSLQFNAWYDDDGPGSGCPDGRLSVAGSPSTTWTSLNSTVATSQGSGLFRGVSPGTAPVQAVYAGITATASLDVISASIPDFSLHANPSSLSVALGSSATSQITITALNGFSGSVTLSQSGLPTGVSMTLPPSLASEGSASPSFPALFRRAAASLLPTLINSSQASTLTLAVSNATLPGAYTIHVTGTSGAISHTLDFPLVITGSPATHLGCNASNTCALLPGAGTPSCSPAGSSCGSGPVTHLGCNASNTCALLPGAGVDSCTPVGSSCLSGPPTHLGCNASNTCVVLAGAGTDSCFSIGSVCSGDVTHHECVNNSCGTIFGAGPDRCKVSSDCGHVVHGECDPLSRSCVNKAGAAPPSCASDAACGPTHLTHFECQNSTCLIVGGAGTDECAGPIGSSCISPFSCTFSATPAALFTPPAASVNLSWSCSGGAGVTNCTVRKVGGPLLISGGGAGSVSNTPAASSQYSLTCTNSGTVTTDTKTITVTVNGLLFHEVSPGGR
jgi:hypothetical protein